MGERGGPWACGSMHACAVCHHQQSTHGGGQVRHSGAGPSGVALRVKLMQPACLVAHLLASTVCSDVGLLPIPDGLQMAAKQARGSASEGGGGGAGLCRGAPTAPGGSSTTLRSLPAARQRCSPCSWRSKKNRGRRLLPSGPRGARKLLDLPWDLDTSLLSMHGRLQVPAASVARRAGAPPRSQGPCVGASWLRGLGK